MDIEEIIQKIVDNGKVEDMRELSDMLEDAIEIIEKAHPEKYKDFIMELYEMAYGCILNEKMAKEIVSNMKPYGEKWTIEQTDRMQRDYNLDFREPDFYVVINSAYNDFNDIFKDDVDQYIKFAIDSLNLSDDLLILAGDNVLDFSLKRFIEYVKCRDSSCVMRYYESDNNRLKRSGVAIIDDDDRIISLEEKPESPKSNWCIPPFYFYKKEDIARIDEAIESGCATDAPGSLVGWMCENSTVYAFEMPGKRYDIGTLENYEQINSNFKGITEQE